MGREPGPGLGAERLVGGGVVEIHRQHPSGEPFGGNLP